MATVFKKSFKSVKALKDAKQMRRPVQKVKCNYKIVMLKVMP